MAFMQRIRDLVIEAIYPQTCAGCGMRGTWLCTLCEEKVILLSSPPCCERCSHLQINGRCDCPNLHPNITHARSCFPYTLWVANAIKHMKYDDEPARAEHLAAYLTDVVASLGPVDGLIPVPLHPDKFRERGYNQSQLLSQWVGNSLGLPVLPLLVKHRATHSQVGLKRQERTGNMKSAFSINQVYIPDCESRYVLIDDVRTTGATLNECVTTLAGAGITQVDIVTVALDMNAEHLKILEGPVRREQP